MSYPKVMKRSCQGHNQVKLDQNRWNSLFVLCSLRFYLLQSMVVKTHLYLSIEIIPKTDYRGFKRVGGVTPLSNHPYASPAWYCTNLQNNRQIVVLRLFARHGDMEIMKHNPSRSTYGDMLWGGASYGCYSDVMTRSSEGHIEVKTASNVEIYFFFQLHSLGII